MLQLTDLLDAYDVSIATIERATLDKKRLKEDIKACKDESDLLAVYCLKEMEGEHWSGLKAFVALINDNNGNDVVFKSIYQVAEEKTLDGECVGYNFIDKPHERVGKIHGIGLTKTEYRIKFYINLGEDNLVLPEQIVKVASEYLARKGADLPDKELERLLREKHERFSKALKIKPTPIPPYVSPERDYALFKVEGKTPGFVVGGPSVRDPCYYLTIGHAK